MKDKNLFVGNTKSLETLTIIIPSYNHEKYIYECLNAASKIKIIGLKILIIDDGSTDKTSQIIKNFIKTKKELNIRLIEKENSGLVSSLNLALEVIDTEYLYICASDDVPIPEGIENCYKLLNENKNLQFCIGGANNFNEMTSEISNTYRKEHDEFFNLDLKKNEFTLFLNYPEPLLLQSTIFSKTSLQNIGGWDSQIKLDDYPIFVKLLKKYIIGINQDFIFVPNIKTVLYRHHGTNTYSNIENQFFMVQQAINKLANESIRDKAIGLKAAYYMLVSIKNKNLKAFLYIFNKCNLNIKLKLPYYIYLTILEYLRK